VVLRLDHVASIIVNADHSIMRAAVELCVADCGVAVVAGALPTR
jgi:hypothetical protein